MLGLALVALLLLLLAGSIAYRLYGKRSSVQRRRRRRRLKSRAIRIDEFMLKPKEAEPD
jgi:hypothetical protein